MTGYRRLVRRAAHPPDEHAGLTEAQAAVDQARAELTEARQLRAAGRAGAADVHKAEWALHRAAGHLDFLRAFSPALEDPVYDLGGDAA